MYCVEICTEYTNVASRSAVAQSLAVKPIGFECLNTNTAYHAVCGIYGEADFCYIQNIIIGCINKNPRGDGILRKIPRKMENEMS